MSRIRVGVFLASVMVVGYCAVALLAQPAVEWVCCESPDGCVSSGGACCDAEAIGMLPCSTELPGYCMKRCVPGGGGF